MTRLALVTGAASGIGRAIASALAEAGDRIALLDRDRTRLEEVGQSISNSTVHVVDLSDSVAIRREVEQIETELGPLDALAHAAGVLRLGGAFDVSERDWSETFRVNLDGAFHLYRAVLPKMMERRHGAVVAVASNAARVPRVNMAAYGASKAALIALTRSMALEVAPHGVRCNTVSPGSTDTPMLRGMHEGEKPSSFDPNPIIGGVPEQFRLGIPLGRIATPNDIANVVAFLLSDAARHITLQDVYVDGGASL